MPNTSIAGRGGGKGGWDFIWYYDTLNPSLAVFTARVLVVTDQILEHMAEKVQAYAQENAPWEDQTGAAREGLTAIVDLGGLRHAIILYHTVEYGIWLEIKHSGLYAIILPTIEVMGPQVMLELQGAFTLL